MLESLNKDDQQIKLAREQEGNYQAFDRTIFPGSNVDFSEIEKAGRAGTISDVHFNRLKEKFHANESITDPRTRLLNQRGLGQEFDEARKRQRLDRGERKGKEMEHRKSDTDYVLIFFIDIDDFKRLNALNGIPSGTYFKGNEVLVLVAQLLKQEALERKGKAGRWGGDEFMIIQEGEGEMTEEDIKMAAKRIEEKLNDSSLYVEYEGKKIYFKISVGGAVVREDDDKTLVELEEESSGKMSIAKKENKDIRKNGAMAGV